jgi:hypothetical protein
MFEKGKSGNPNGRPKGRPDRRIIYREALEGRASELVSKAVSLALSGDTAALKMCVDRILPRDAPITGIEFNGEDLNAKAQKVFEAVATGELTPSQGADLVALLVGASRIKVDERQPPQEPECKADYSKLSTDELRTLRALLVKAGDDDMG